MLEARRRIEGLIESGAAAHEDAKAKRMEIDRLDVELKGQEGKVKQLTIQLNTVKTNKEYAALQHEIAAHKADADILEDRMLVLMEEMDQAEAARVAHQERLEAERHTQAETEQHAQRETAAIEGKIADLSRQRDAFFGQIDPELGQLYEGLISKRDSRAMVRAASLGGDNRSCSGCFMRLTSNTTSRLMAGNELVRCHSCGRILYIDDAEQAET